VPASLLVEGWDSPVEKSATQEYGKAWIASGASAVLKVPSAVVQRDSNYVINVNHSDFQAFRFDPRLK
jgi:RES domain-containing protein